ncbi:MAG: hypothetical protein V2I33_07675, partial [Kangiellaceae bacterium]|jgi:hypothetical protein|nr:hypothetical protein [Kangiellaceae bacterium]
MQKFSHRLFGATYQYVKQNPGLLISLSYVVWATLGVIYLNEYYSLFNISILKYLEISDVLVAGLQEPKVTLAFFAAILVLWTLIFISDLGEYYRSKIQKPKNFFLRVIYSMVFYTPKRLNVARLIFVVGLILYFQLFIALISRREQANLLAHPYTTISVIQNEQPIRPQCDLGSSNQWLLLGTTAKFSFVHHLECRESLVIGNENIDQIILHQVTYPENL